jgi:hypothetical protein
MPPAGSRSGAKTGSPPCCPRRKSQWEYCMRLYEYATTWEITCGAGVCFATGVEGLRGGVARGGGLGGGVRTTMGGGSGCRCRQFARARTASASQSQPRHGNSRRVMVSIFPVRTLTLVAHNDGLLRIDFELAGIPRQNPTAQTHAATPRFMKAITPFIKNAIFQGRSSCLHTQGRWTTFTRCINRFCPASKRLPRKIALFWK